MRIENTVVGPDQYRTEVDLGAAGKMSGTYRVSPAIEFSSFESTVDLPREVAEEILYWPIEGDWSRPVPMLRTLHQGGHDASTLLPLARVLGVQFCPTCANCRRIETVNAAQEVIAESCPDCA